MDKIQTLHPEAGKTNKRIDRDKYDVVHAAILKALKPGAMSHTELKYAVAKLLGPNFEGGLAWYNETVKLDLEARGEVERFKDGTRLLFRLTAK